MYLCMLGKLFCPSEGSKGGQLTRGDLCQSPLNRTPLHMALKASSCVKVWGQQNDRERPLDVEKAMGHPAWQTWKLTSWNPVLPGHKSRYSWITQPNDFLKTAPADTSNTSTMNLEDKLPWVI